MKSTFLIISLLNFTLSFGQMLSNEKANILSEEPFFNINFINSVKLRALNGTVSTKQELGTIKSAGQKQNYLFNNLGQLSCYYTTKIKNRKRDTNFIFYKYGSKGNLVVKRYSDSYGFYSYSNKYNDQGLKINQIYSREKNASKSKINFSLKEQYVVFEESYKYLNKDSIISKTTLNSNGRPYQKQQTFYNSLGYMTEISSRLLINNKFSRETYEYNDKGFLKSVEYFIDNSEKPYKAFKYDYDEWGNVTFVDEYKDQKRIIHKELLYNHSTFILKTILSQDLVTNLITITKFKPQFYD